MPDLYELPTEQPLGPRRHAAARSQLERYATSWRERLGRRWHHLGIVLGLGIGLSVAGGATAGTIYLTKGRSLYARRTRFPACTGLRRSGCQHQGWLRTTEIRRPRHRIPRESAPVCDCARLRPESQDSDWAPLSGHWVHPLGPESTLSAMPSDCRERTTSTIPCRSTTKTVPDIVGMDTPDGTAILLTGGMLVLSANAHLRSVPVGHIISTSPAPGSKFPASTPVTVVNSLGP